MFDLSKPGVGVTSSSFGGDGPGRSIKPGGKRCAAFSTRTLAPIPVAPMNGNGEMSCVGYIVEPHQSADLAEHLRASGAAWEVV